MTATAGRTSPDTARPALTGLNAPHSPATARQGHVRAGEPRPAGVWWARSGPRRGDRMCEDPAHPVYVRRLARPKRGEPDTLEGVDVYACASCWPPGGEGRGKGGGEGQVGLG